MLDQIIVLLCLLIMFVGFGVIAIIWIPKLVCWPAERRLAEQEQLLSILQSLHWDKEQQ